MKVLLLRANPRKTGFTQRLADLFAQGAQEAGARVTDVDLTNLTLEPCSGCFHCWLADPGSCVHADSMNDLLPQVVENDVLVCATPLYFFSMSAVLKAFFERTFPLTQPGFAPSKRGKIRNSLRYPDQWQGKTMVTLVTGALRDLECYRPLRETFQLMADALDFEWGGQLTRPESALLDYPLSKPLTLKKIEAACLQAGREVANTGRLTDTTIETAALPLAADHEHFVKYSNIFYQRAQELGPAALDPSKIAKVVAFDVRILMREMARFLNPQTTANVRAILQFEFPDQQLVFVLRIDHGRCDLQEGSMPNPDLVIRCNASVWASLFTRQSDPRELLKSGQLVLKGDKSIFTRLDRYFTPPA